MRELRDLLGLALFTAGCAVVVILVYLAPR